MGRWQRWRAMKRSTSDGYTMVEFAVASVVFLAIVFGVVDFGRSIYLYSQLNNGVREAAREAKVGEANGFGWSDGTITHRVRVAKNPETSAESGRPGLSGAAVTYSCAGGCAPGDLLTIEAELPFRALTQTFLGIGPITLNASATVTIE